MIYEYSKDTLEDHPSPNWSSNVTYRHVSLAPTGADIVQVLVQFINSNPGWKTRAVGDAVGAIEGGAVGATVGAIEGALLGACVG
jgi:hypothetical protein